MKLKQDYNISERIKELETGESGLKRTKKPLNKKSKPKKKHDKKKLRKKLEELVKKYVKNRDKNICQKCGVQVQGTNCHASHVIPVSANGRLAYDDLNLKVLCYHHHINWWHKNPVEAGTWYRDKFPERWEYLEKKHQEQKGSIKPEWYLEKIEHYKNLLK